MIVFNKKSFCNHLLNDKTKSRVRKEWEKTYSALLIMEDGQ